MAPKGTKKAATSEKELDQVINSFCAATAESKNARYEEEMNFITEELRNNEGLRTTIYSMIKVIPFP